MLFSVGHCPSRGRCQLHWDTLSLVSTTNLCTTLRTHGFVVRFGILSRRITCGTMWSARTTGWALVCHLLIQLWGPTPTFGTFGKNNERHGIRCVYLYECLKMVHGLAATSARKSGSSARGICASHRCSGSRMLR